MDANSIAELLKNGNGNTPLLIFICITTLGGAITAAANLIINWQKSSQSTLIAYQSSQILDLQHEVLQLRADKDHDKILADKKINDLENVIFEVKEQNSQLIGFLRSDENRSEVAKDFLQKIDRNRST